MMIRTIDGREIHADVEAVTHVVGTAPGVKQMRTVVYGPTPAPIRADEDAGAFVERVRTAVATPELPQPFAQLTSPDGAPVWIKGGEVSAVFAVPNKGKKASASAPDVTVMVAGERPVVREAVAEARDELNTHGAKL